MSQDRPQSPADGRSVSAAVHSAGAFTGDRRPVFSAYMGNLPPSVARDASFAVPIGGRLEDKRGAHEKTVAGCEGASCVIRTASDG